MANATFEELLKLAEGAEGGGFSDEELGEGDHDVVVKVSTFGPSPNGFDQISLLFEDANGASSPWDNLTFSDNATAVKIALEKLKALGYTLAGEFNGPRVAAAIKGAPATITIKPEKKEGIYKGKLRIVSVKSRDAGVQVPASLGKPKGRGF